MYIKITQVHPDNSLHDKILEVKKITESHFYATFIGHSKVFVIPKNHAEELGDDWDQIWEDIK